MSASSQPRASIHAALRQPAVGESAVCPQRRAARSEARIEVPVGGRSWTRVGGRECSRSRCRSMPCRMTRRGWRPGLPSRPRDTGPLTRERGSCEWRVGRRNQGVMHMLYICHRNPSPAIADIDDGVTGPKMLECGFDEVPGLGVENQHVGREVASGSIEFPGPTDVLGRHP